MEVKEVEITKKEKIYSFTESELEELKCEERTYGSNKTREYILFCYNNYIWKKNLKGLLNFISSIIPFLEGKTNVIENNFGYSLHEWRKKYDD